MFERKGNLFVVSGPSGAGKGSIIKELKKQRSDLWVSISATSRSARQDEEEGVSYYFMSKEQFAQKIENQQFLEWADVFGNYYGTLKTPVIDALLRGKNVILEIDIQGALQIKSMYDEAIFIFVLPPSLEELRKRIIHRGSETEESLKMRLQMVLKEISYIEKYDYFIINDTLEDSIRTMDAILTAENARVAQDIVSLLQNQNKGFRFD